MLGNCYPNFVNIYFTFFFNLTVFISYYIVISLIHISTPPNYKNK